MVVVCSGETLANANPSLQINAWAVYNRENKTSMTQKEFIKSVALGLIRESNPMLARELSVPSSHSSDTESDDVLSPAAREVTPAARFFCSKPKKASIAKSKKYK